MKALTRAALGVVLAGLLVAAAPAPSASADECDGLLPTVLCVVDRILSPAEPQPVPPAPQPSQPAPQPSKPAPAPPAAPQTPVEEPAAPSGGGTEPAPADGGTAPQPQVTVEVPYPEPTGHSPAPSPTSEADVDLQYDRDSVVPFLPEDKIQRQVLFWWLAGAALFFTAISLGALFAWFELRKNRRVL